MLQYCIWNYLKYTKNMTEFCFLTEKADVFSWNIFFFEILVSEYSEQSKLKPQ